MTTVDETATVWAPGSAVLSVGAGEDDVEMLAVWQVSPTGAPTGAWVLPLADVLGSKEQSRRILALVERRALVGSSQTDLPTLLEKLGDAAGIPAEPWWTPHLFSPVEAFTETIERRARYSRTVANARQDNKAITPLEWAHDLPDDLSPESSSDLRRLARISEPPGTPVVAGTLAVVRVLRWLVAVWNETEQVKNRRRYVRDEHGAPEGLPPSWLTAVTAENSTRLPL